YFDLKIDLHLPYISPFDITVISINSFAPNARLRGWQRIPLNSNTTTATTAAQWDWKRYALTVALEAFVNSH
ncbi:hypothetical protein Q5N58_18040, partial [Vibrio cholerae]|uniref:hypothetical protein n=1 Tax=Vibrio cholerae TaxID=666 RepID=UPI002934D16D